MERHQHQFLFIAPVCGDLRARCVSRCPGRPCPLLGALCVCRTSDGGRTWRTFRKGLPQKNAYDITLRHALDNADGTLAFGTTTGNLYVSEDRGRSWSCVGNNFPLIYSVRFAG